MLTLHEKANWDIDPGLNDRYMFAEPDPPLANTLNRLEAVGFPKAERVGLTQVTADVALNKATARHQGVVRLYDHTVETMRQLRSVDGRWPEDTLARLKSTPAAFAAYVLRVLDGDTIVLSNVRGSSDGYRVRLIGMDAPEWSHPNKPINKKLAEESRDALEELMHVSIVPDALRADPSVCVVLDPSQGLFDRYGRVLAHVFGQIRGLWSLDRFPVYVNANHVYVGMAKEYAPGGPHLGFETIHEAQTQARDDRVGFWSEKGEWEG